MFRDEGLRSCLESKFSLWCFCSLSLMGKRDRFVTVVPELMKLMNLMDVLSLGISSEGRDDIGNWYFGSVKFQFNIFP